MSLTEILLLVMGAIIFAAALSSDHYQDCQAEAYSLSLFDSVATTVEQPQHQAILLANRSCATQALSP
jgi:hypothetical protein